MIDVILLEATLSFYQITFKVLNRDKNVQVITEKLFLIKDCT